MKDVREMKSNDVNSFLEKAGISIKPIYGMAAHLWLMKVSDEGLELVKGKNPDMKSISYLRDLISRLRTHTLNIITAQHQYAFVEGIIFK